VGREDFEGIREDGERIRHIDQWMMVVRGKESWFQGVFEQRFINLGQTGQGPSQVLELCLSETSRG